MTQLEPITGHYVDIDGTRIFFDECGEGTPFLCVHTAQADSREYRYVLPLLARHGFRAIAMDLPGHSRSNAINWEPTRSIHVQAEFVHRFGQVVCPGEKPVVTGMSIGGDICFDLAANRSSDYLAIVPQEGAAWTPTFPDPAEAEEPSWALSWTLACEEASTSSLPPQVSEFKRKELAWMHRAPQQAGSGDLQGWARHDVRGKLGGLKCPLLIINGRADFYVPIELNQLSMAEMGDMAELHDIPNVGHYPMFEEPEQMVDLVIDFLKRRGIDYGKR